MRSPIVLLVALTVALSACGGDKNPNNPSPQPQPQAPTRIIRIDGTLSFGDVVIGQTTEQTIRVFNDGTAALTVSGMSGPTGFAPTWVSGTIAPGASQSSIFRFSPTAAQSYSGTLTVNGDQTSGANTAPITARGVLPPRPRFGLTGIGDSVFDLPKDAARLRIIGIYNGNSSNFVVKIAGRLVVNELIGTGWSQTRYQGDHLVPAECAATPGVTCIVTVEISSGVNWSFEEIGR